MVYPSGSSRTENARVSILTPPLLPSNDDPTAATTFTRPHMPFDEALVYHQLWRFLLRGHPPLPVELVRLIFRAASIMVPVKDRIYRAEHGVHIRVPNCNGQVRISRVWFCTPPLLYRRRPAAIQLVTVSRDGWSKAHTNICHSWFEWGIFPASPFTEYMKDGGAITGDEDSWPKDASGKSRWRRSHGNAVAVGKFQQHNGPRVEMHDEMWDDVKEGSVIAVRACAQQALWENAAKYGEVVVWQWFEPLLRLLLAQQAFK
ncbi:hypothetical protein CYLTODRAFT_294207 [Cylindrobasidium torrendii FP15055 ss-10]|uniref:Uncharacterized protein n=1 Tax=Cylindrobasidium torrendii FP15055 ss-10 TaxID=1314674 RepID=A0A0D7BA52_9AGAR|nr:hypothetical protein CYLTODRAFT_294207 [Cylindrobasidium torrendii FP15055 ss-10]